MIALRLTEAPKIIVATAMVWWRAFWPRVRCMRVPPSAHQGAASKQRPQLPRAELPCLACRGSPAAMAFQRYAIYYTPTPGPFAQACAAWLGWDSAAGAPCPHPAVSRLPVLLQDLTHKPRKYGFHATLMAPFHPAPGVAPVDLCEALAQVASTVQPIAIADLRLTWMGRILALVPDDIVNAQPQAPAETRRTDTVDDALGALGALGALATTVVKRLGAFRVPPVPVDPATHARRGLSTRRAALLHRRGDPFTHDQFRFHMTLTGSVPAELKGAVEAAAECHIGPHIPRPMTVDAVTLLGSDDQARFHQIARVPLGHAI